MLEANQKKSIPFSPVWCLVPAKTNRFLLLLLQLRQKTNHFKGVTPCLRLIHWVGTWKLSRAQNGNSLSPARKKLSRQLRRPKSPKNRQTRTTRRCLMMTGRSFILLSEFWRQRKAFPQRDLLPDVLHNISQSKHVLQAIIWRRWQRWGHAGNKFLQQQKRGSQKSGQEECKRFGWGTKLPRVIYPTCALCWWPLSHKENCLSSFADIWGLMLSCTCRRRLYGPPPCTSWALVAGGLLIMWTSSMNSEYHTDTNVSQHLLGGGVQIMLSWNWLFPQLFIFGLGSRALALSGFENKSFCFPALEKTATLGCENAFGDPLLQTFNDPFAQMFSSTLSQHCIFRTTKGRLPRHRCLEMMTTMMTWTGWVRRVVGVQFLIDHQNDADIYANVFVLSHSSFLHLPEVSHWSISWHCFPRDLTISYC